MTRVKTINKRLDSVQRLFFSLGIVLIPEPCCYKFEPLHIFGEKKHIWNLFWLWMVNFRWLPRAARCVRPACEQQFSVLLRKSEWFLNVIQDQTLPQTKPIKKKKIGASFGENKLGKEVQCIGANNQAFGKAVHTDTWVHGFEEGCCRKRRCNLSPTDLRAVPFLCNITDVTSEPRWLYSHVGLGCNLNNWTDEMYMEMSSLTFVVLYYTINS